MLGQYCKTTPITLSLKDRWSFFIFLPEKFFRCPCRNTTAIKNYVRKALTFKSTEPFTRPSPSDVWVVREAARQFFVINVAPRVNNFFLRSTITELVEKTPPLLSRWREDAIIPAPEKSDFTASWWKYLPNITHKINGGQMYDYVSEKRKWI